MMGNLIDSNEGVADSPDANAAGELLLDRIAAIEDVVLQIPFMRTAR